MMIAKTTLCLSVITTTCQTAAQFARGEIAVVVVKTPTTVASCNQIGRLSALINQLSWQVNNSSFEKLEEAQRGDRLKMRIFEFRNRIRIFERNTNIRIFEHSLTSLEY